MKCFAFALPVVFFSSVSIAKVKTEKLEYKSGETVLEGVIAYDDARKNKVPGIIVVHEWMGLNDFAIRKAKEIAALGYVALAADIYGKGVRAKDMKEASVLAGKYKGDRSLLRERAKAAYDALIANKNVKAERVAALGFCFGGTTALEMARSGLPLKGVVSFHGGLDSPQPQDGKNIKAKVLVLHGAVDPYVPADQVAAFLKELNDAHVDYQMISYSNAVHGFTNPDNGSDNSKGAAYNAVADQRSFAAMKAFLKEVL